MISNVADLLKLLVRIDSVNPDLVPGGAGETVIARFILKWLDQRGFETHWLEATPGRPSVVGIARGSGGGRSLMFNGHLDTVTTAGMSIPPLEPSVQHGRMYGRGVYDMKAGVAAMLVAADQARGLNLRGDVIVACVSDEENASIGSSEVAEHFFADAAIVCEPTNLELVTAHKGFDWATITTHGVASHGSRPDLGVDAIAKMGAVLMELERLGERLTLKPAHPLVGHGSIHASLIRGGKERSSYPASCVLDVERRTIPGESFEVVQTELRDLLERCRASDPKFNATLEMGLHREPHGCDESELIVQTLSANATGILGITPKIAGAAYWTDCAILSSVGIPSLLFGPSGEGAHAAVEWVDLASVEQCVSIYLETIKAFCA